MEDVCVGDRICVREGFSNDSFRQGMEGVVMENHKDLRNCLVLFDCKRQAQTVGYRYLKFVKASTQNGECKVPAPKEREESSKSRSQTAPEDTDHWEDSKSLEHQNQKVGELAPEGSSARLQEVERQLADVCNILKSSDSNIVERLRDALGVAPVPKSEPEPEVVVDEAKISNEEVKMLQQQLHEKEFELRRLASQTERQLEDGVTFVQRVCKTSACNCLDKDFALEDDAVELLGMGNYGYVMTCVSRPTGGRVVMKLQSARWASVVIKEWAHGSVHGSHPNIVEYLDAYVHHDADKFLQKIISSGFESGKLKGNRPKVIPDRFLCMALEYMDGGTVQGFADLQLLDEEGVGAVLRQVSSALAFIHKQKCTHNDIKPENILFKRAPDQSTLVAKLADFGLAEYSLERERDHDLLAFTTWCLAMGRPFEKMPKEGDDRVAAVVEMGNMAPADLEVRKIWRCLVDAIGGLWQGTMAAAEVFDLQRLRFLEVKLPQDTVRRQTTVIHLEAASKEACVEQFRELERRNTRHGTQSQFFRHFSDSERELHDSDSDPSP